MCICGCHSKHVAIRGQPEGINYLLSSGGSQASNSGQWLGG